MQRRHRAIVIPTQRRSPAWIKFLAAAAVLSGVALGGTLLGLRLMDEAPTSQTTELLPPPLLLEPPAAGAAPLQPSGRPGPVGSTSNPPHTLKPPAPVCADCGVVESVEKRVRSAPATGVGAVAGGVVGGLVGNQFGKGDGRRAMTVVGAVGGGVLGHEIEKQQRAHTEYRVRVRMADGSLRERTHTRALTVGSPVRVSEQGLQPMATPH